MGWIDEFFWQNVNFWEIQISTKKDLAPTTFELQKRTLPFWKRLGMYIKWLKGNFCKIKIKDAIMENTCLLFFASPSISLYLEQNSPLGGLQNHSTIQS